MKPARPRSPLVGVVLALSVLLVAATPAPDTTTDAAPLSVVTILDVSDFHGNLLPVTQQIGGVSRPVGGAAYLDTYFDRIRATSGPENTFLVTAGDAVGATPALSSLLKDRPTIEVMNMMGFNADTLGNHNFDRGVRHMRWLESLADFPYVVSNLVNNDGNRPPWVRPSVIRETGDVRIGFTGAINPEAPTLVAPGNFGTLRILDPAVSINRAARWLELRGVRTVVALVHIGATGLSSRAATGPLVDLARRLRGVDVLIGDHTNMQVNQTEAGADGKPILVIENLSKGATFTEVKLVVDTATGEATGATARIHTAFSDLVEPDPEIQAAITRYREKVAPQLERIVGHSTVAIPTSHRVAESNQGNLVTDAMRATYGVDFAFENSGGLRADLTRADDTDEAGRFVIRMGYVLDMLPFGNVAVTLEVTGEELKRILENGVSSMPSAAGRFIQVSGLRFGYRTSERAGQRVQWVRRPDGSPVDLSPNSTYRIAMNDFMAAGGDTYPNFSGRFDTRDLLDQVVASYIASKGEVSPEGPIPPATAPETRIFRLD